MKENTLSRRGFIQMAVLGSGSLLLFPRCNTPSTNSGWRFFSEEEANTIISIAEQFIPADKDPGATDADVVNFIDKQLTGPYARFQEEYRKGIACLINSCESIYSKSFPLLKWDEQTHFLELMEKGKLATEHWVDINQSSFFRKLLDHSMQGFYGSPRHGGNRNFVSYKMMKLDYPHILGQNRYSSIVEQLKTEENEK